ncbi:hypothetical protein Caci_2998 [Catenulispora acidiphila DSM 44928]|uniref:Uncharacterized protein n=1 Tax=Catenulispora acidiphila (strain DSM 44928 / JCM 14897 / NBRC 102108 / NRRL B-24433 / ID139908) TaxID=479433 RepID=C7Q315_CATAD|nr:hypothetical protein [Catenulispora acidiphila]ACU71907.1 hypothetical protein Caci_2998 [Catenulispora acidiphila DSM 44928]
MSRPWTLADVRQLILSERTALTALAEIGIPTDQAPSEIADQVARINALLAEITPLLSEIEAACGIQED